MRDEHADRAVEQWGQRLEVAYLEHRGRIVDLLRAKHPVSAVEDAMQEIFAQLLGRMPQTAVAREVTLGSAYLFECVRRRLVRTLVVDQRRRESARNACRRGAIESSQSTPPKGDPLHRIEPIFDEEELTFALSRLSTKQQEVLRLICAENVRRHDGAKSLGCDENCFGVRRHRALIALREMLIHDEARVDRPSQRPPVRNSPPTPRPSDDHVRQIST